MDEEKKVDAVREFYKTVIGDMDAVQRLQLISTGSILSKFPNTFATGIEFKGNLTHCCINLIA